MIVNHQRTTVVPRPRTTEDTPGEFPWPEPWHSYRGARPRTEFWDVATASWRSRGPVVPGPRSAD